MTDTTIKVREHYRATGLTERIKAALATIAPGSQALTIAPGMIFRIIVSYFSDPWIRRHRRVSPTQLSNPPGYDGNNGTGRRALLEHIQG